MSNPVEELVAGEALGAYLKRIRESKGLSLEELSQKTRISFETLQSIEAGEWNKFPIEAYIRGYLNSVSKALGLEPAVVLSLFSKEVGSSYSREFMADSAIAMEEGNFSGGKLKSGKNGTKAVVIVLILLAVAFFAGMHFLKSEKLPESPVPENVPSAAIDEDSTSFGMEIPEGAENIPPESLSAVPDSLPMKAALDSARKEAAKGNSATTFITSSASKSDSAAPVVSGKVNILIERLDSATSWIGFYRSLNDNQVLKEGNLSSSRSKISYEYGDTLCVVIGNPDAVRRMVVNGKALEVPVVKGRSSRFCVTPDGKFTRR